MALDGIVISNLVYELNQTILNAKISKIAQPENDELLLTCKGSNGQYRLAMSASASLPFVYLTSENKPSPMTAPTFCMVLRSSSKRLALLMPKHSFHTAYTPAKYTNKPEFTSIIYNLNLLSTIHSISFINYLLSSIIYQLSACF